MAWDYAELSKSAKAAGGPEVLVDSLIEAGKRAGEIAGKKAMIPWLCVALSGGALLTLGLVNLVDFFKKNKKKTDEELEKARAELIQGIKDYDEANPNQNSEENRGD